MNKEAIDFGVDHTFTIIEKSDEYSDYYHFSTHLSSKSINQVYLANYDLLKQFISYFKNTVKRSKELSEAYNIKIACDQATPGYIIKDIDNILLLNNQRSDFIAQIQTAHLSKRENECLYHIIRGKTAKEIATLLGISFRTVETHLAHIKEKFKVSSRSELIDKWMDFYS